MKVFIAADHRGFTLKEKLRPWLMEQGYTVEDLGAATFLPEDDYPDYAVKVAQQVAQSADHRGVVICGSGVGVDVVANKIDGVRCGYAATIDEIKSSRADDDINTLALGADYINEDQAEQLLTAFLTTPFTKAERFERRIEKIEAIEHTN